MLAEIRSSSPTPSIDLDTVKTSLEDISLSESCCSSNRNSRNLEETHFVSEHFPDLIPRNFQNIVEVNDKPTAKEDIVKDESTKKSETIILLLILFITIFSLYLFPPP